MIPATLWRVGSRIFINDNVRMYADIDPRNFYTTLGSVYEAAGIAYTAEPNAFYEEVYRLFAEYKSELSEARRGKLLKETDEGNLREFLVTEVMSKLHLKTLRDTGEILYYEKGVYRSGGENEILRVLHQIAKYELTNTRRAEVISSIKSQTGTDRSEFESDDNVWNLKNGLLNLETGKLSSHKVDYLSLIQLPVEFDPRASCPTIMRFLTQVLDNTGLAIVIRLFGYLLCPRPIFEKAFMFVGEGSNGKSTLIRLIISFIGRNNTSNISLQDFASDRYAAADLYTKIVNVFADLGPARIADSGMFKTLVSGDRIRAQKKHQHPFYFENRAKFVFSTNYIPETSDSSYAYYRRWIIIPFNHTFEGADRDEHLIAKLEKELPGLLNIALVGMRRLIKEGGFEDTEINDIKIQYEISASKIKEFIEQCCTLGEHCSLPAKVLQKAYIRYCRAKGSSYIDIRYLGEALHRLGCMHVKRQKKGKRQYYYLGIQLKVSNCPDKLLENEAQ